MTESEWDGRVPIVEFENWLAESPWSSLDRVAESHWPNPNTLVESPWPNPRIRWLNKTAGSPLAESDWAGRVTLADSENTSAESPWPNPRILWPSHLGRIRMGDSIENSSGFSTGRI